MEIAVLALAGILLGGLVNALADKLPQGRLPGIPRYQDGSARPLIAWLGLSAFLCDRRSIHGGGKARQEKLSWRYPLTELALTALFLAAHYVAGAKAQASIGQQLLWHGYAVVFVLLAVVDIEHKQILLMPVSATSLLALFAAAAWPQHAPDLPGSLAGGGVSGLVFSLVYAGGQVFARICNSPREMPTPFGKGDVCLMAMGGLILGFPNALAAMVLAIFLGGVGALAYLLAARLRGRRPQRFTALPYGPYILAAIYFVMLFPGAIGLGIWGA